MVLITDIKLRPAWQVDPGPGQPGGWIGLGKIKDWPKQQPNKTRSTHDPGEPGWDPMFFFIFSNVVFLIYPFFYICLVGY